MKRFLSALIAVLWLVCFCSCSPTSGNNDGDIDAPLDNEIIEKEIEKEKDMTEFNQLLVKIGDNSFIIQLADNATTRAIKQWLNGEEMTVSASNYGGFEKILSLGKSFPTDDKQVTTCRGDVMLYSGSQIVIFYEPNSWAYTRIGQVIDDGKIDLATILSGDEEEVKISLVRG